MKKKIIFLLSLVILMIACILILTQNVNADAPYMYVFANMSYDQVKDIRIW